VAAEYVSQTVKVGSITHADNYTGTLKFVMEAGYAYSMGIMEGTGRLEVGYSLTSTARSARRAGIEIKYLITSPPRFIQTLLTQTKAFSIADLVMNIAMVKTQIGQATLSVPTASDVSSLGGGDYLAGPTTSPTASPTAAPTALPDKELMGLPLATLVYGLLTLVLLMCLCCWIYFYCVWSIEWVQQTRSPEHKEQRRAKRGSNLNLMSDPSRRSNSWSTSITRHVQTSRPTSSTGVTPCQTTTPATTMQYVLCSITAGERQHRFSAGMYQTRRDKSEFEACCLTTAAMVQYC